MRRFPVAFFLLLAPALAAQSFKNPRRIPTAADPTIALAGDLNGDGRVDLIYDTPAFAPASAVLHPLLADGKGGYIPGQDVTLPSPLMSRCGLGDLNGDGSPDLVCVALSPSASMGVLLGQGDGTFGPVTLYSPPDSSSCDSQNPAAIADVDGDAHADVLVTCQNQAKIFLYRGDGHGHLTPSATVRSSANAVSVADLNGDGRPDLVTQASGSASTEVLLGNGDGTFAHASYPAGDQGAVLADIDGDGHPDLIGGGFGIMRIFHGNSDGSFGTTPIVTVDYTDGTTTPSHSDGSGMGVYISPLACADLNGDGVKDILAYGYDGLTVILGEPGLRFEEPKNFSVGTGWFPGVGLLAAQLMDLDGDGHLDLIKAGPEGLYLSYGRNDGSFVGADVYRSGLGVKSVTAADFNEDGFVDVVTSGDTQLQLSAGKTDSTFAPAQPISGRLPPMVNTAFTGFSDAQHGDLDGDGHQDLIAAGSHGTDSALYEVKGNGDGTFGTPVLIRVLDSFEYIAAVQDLNGDGRDDILLNGSAVTEKGVALLSQADGSFRAVPFTLSDRNAQPISPRVSVGDVNGDGFPDLAYATGGALAVELGRGDGSFNPPLFYAAPNPPTAAARGTATAIGDFDGDGAVDVAVLFEFTPPPQTYYAGHTQVRVFYRQGRGITLDDDSFQGASSGPTSQRYYTALQALDIDGDGSKDVLASSYEAVNVPNALGLFAGQSTRTLGAAALFVDGLASDRPVIADVNLDGHPDLIAANVSGNAFTVLLSEGSPGAAGTLQTMPNPVLIGDLFSLTAKLQAGGQSAALEGTVTFAIDGVALGSAALKDGVAVIAGPTTLAAGVHQLSAETTPLVQGNTSFPPAQLQGKMTVKLRPVAVSLTATPSAVTAGQNLNFHAQVQNPAGTEAGAPAPVGAVSVSVDGVPAAAGGRMDAAGVSFDIPYAFANAGTHVVTVTYGGDASHSSGAATVSLSVVASAAAGTFTLGVSPASLTVASGQQGKVALDLTSVGEFQGTVLLAYGDLPDSVTATLSSNAVDVSAGTHGAATLVLTTGVTQHSQPPRGRHARSAIVTLGLGAMLLLPGWRRRQSLRGVMVACFAALSLMGLNGCGSLREPLGGTSLPGVFHITVSAISRGSTTAQMQEITLTVTP